MKKLAVILFCFFTVVALQAEPIQWEYKVAILPEADTLEDMLDSYGSMGWELTSVSDNNTAIFKRSYSETKAQVINDLYDTYCNPSGLFSIEYANEYIWAKSDEKRVAELKEYFQLPNVFVEGIRSVNQKTIISIIYKVPAEYLNKNIYSEKDIENIFLSMEEYIYNMPIGEDNKIDGLIVAELADQAVGFLSFIYTAEDDDWDINIGV